VVLRAYDNRAVYTERRPDVYLLSEGLKGSTETVCDFQYDVGIGRNTTGSPWPSTAKDFGRIPEGSDRSDWLWADRQEAGCSSRLLVISTPYYPGRHWAKSVDEFIPLVKELESFHSENFLHGDIRATNTAFCENDKSKLFDWDMGGRVKVTADDAGQVRGKSSGEGEVPSDEDVLKYPEGFNKNVFDGIRDRRAGAGQPITKVHDWVALTWLILDSHNIVPPQEVAADSAAVVLTVRLQQKKQDLLTFPKGSTGANIVAHVAELRDFLVEVGAQKWEVILNLRLETGLIDYGYVLEDNQAPPELQQGSAAATGSPDKELAKYFASEKQAGR
jgi:hypothetical protein